MVSRAFPKKFLMQFQVLFYDGKNQKSRHLRKFLLQKLSKNKNAEKLKINARNNYSAHIEYAAHWTFLMSGELFLFQIVTVKLLLTQYAKYSCPNVNKTFCNFYFQNCWFPHFSFRDSLTVPSYITYVSLFQKFLLYKWLML